MAPLEVQTLRFVYADEITELLHNFAKEHQNEDRKQFKTQWNDWTNKEEIKEILNKEIKRLEGLGLEEDIMERMFKSTKYYYSKKIQNKIKPPSKPKPQVKNYTTFSPIILKAMDEHIHNYINGCAEKTENKPMVVSPAEAYNDFCNKNKDALLQEIIDYRKRILLEQKVQKIINKDIEFQDDRLNPDILSEKIKKTYKNRIYIITRNNDEKNRKN